MNHKIHICRGNSIVGTWNVYGIKGFCCKRLKMVGQPHNIFRCCIVDTFTRDYKLISNIMHFMGMNYVFNVLYSRHVAAKKFCQVFISNDKQLQGNLLAFQWTSINRLKQDIFQHNQLEQPTGKHFTSSFLCLSISKVVIIHPASFHRCEVEVHNVV